MKRLMGFGMAVLAVLVLAGAARPVAAGTGGEGKLDVKLGAIPKTATSASGHALFTLSGDGKTLHYEITVDRIADVTMGHIHEVAAGGAPGAVAAWLFPAGEERAGLRAGTFTGTLVTGDIGADRLRGPYAGASVKELFGKLENGKAGVALHTKANPGGELWGIAKAEAARTGGGKSEGYGGGGY